MSSSRSETASAPAPDEPERTPAAGAEAAEAASGGAGPSGGRPPSGAGPAAEASGARLLAALLDGMDAALCAFDAEGRVTHWNREAERILGWSAAEAVGRLGFTGWAVRAADAADLDTRLTAAMAAPGRQVHEFALLRKDGGRVLVRTQTAGVRGPDGVPTGLYCAFSEVHAQIDLERSIALSEAMFDDAPWGVVLVDVDLRPTVVNGHAARALGIGRTTLLGRPLGDVVTGGAEELEAALTHVLAEGAPGGRTELWVTLRTAEGERRRCWSCGFLRLASPLAEQPVPLGVAWLFQDVTEDRQARQEADRSRFRASQLRRADAAAAECEDPMEAAATHLDFALAGYADHVLLDLCDGDHFRRAAASPAGGPGPVGRAPDDGRLPVRYAAGHPARQAVERRGAVRTSAGAAAEGWAAERRWPADAVHGLATVLRSRGRTLGVLTFLRGAGRPAFERPDAEYAQSVAARVAAAVDLARTLD